MTTTTSRQSTPRGSKLGEGGEAEIFALPTRPTEVLKLYWPAQSDQARADKLAYMVGHPPADPGGPGWTCIAWPTALEVDVGQGRHGFLMPRIDTSRAATLFQLYTPRERMRTAPGFSWKYLLRTAANLSRVVGALHAAGYVIGDLNESNFLVSDTALVAAVDCDSFQVRDPVEGRLFRCTVAKWERVAPEFQTRNLNTVELTEEADRFALAVLVFQLLMEGVHPFQCASAGGEPMPLEERIRRRHFPYARRSRREPPRHALPLRVLPPELVRLMRRAFEAGAKRPAARPSADDWCAALTAAEQALTRCSVQPHHWYGGHLRRCPWCERQARGYPDTFAAPAPAAAPVSKRPATVAPVVPAAPPATQRVLAGRSAGLVRLLHRHLPLPIAALAAVMSVLLPTVAALLALSAVVLGQGVALPGRVRQRLPSSRRRSRREQLGRPLQWLRACAHAGGEGAVVLLTRLTRLAGWAGCGLVLALLTAGVRWRTESAAEASWWDRARTAFELDLGILLSSALLFGVVYDGLRRAPGEGRPGRVLRRRMDELRRMPVRRLVGTYLAASILVPAAVVAAPTSYLPHGDQDAGLDAVRRAFPLVPLRTPETRWEMRVRASLQPCRHLGQRSEVDVQQGDGGFAAALELDRLSAAAAVGQVRATPAGTAQALAIGVARLHQTLGRQVTRLDVSLGSASVSVDRRLLAAGPGTVAGLLATWRIPRADADTRGHLTGQRPLFPRAGPSTLQGLGDRCLGLR